MDVPGIHHVRQIHARVRHLVVRGGTVGNIRTGETALLWALQRTSNCYYTIVAARRVNDNVFTETQEKQRSVQTDEIKRDVERLVILIEKSKKPSGQRDKQTEKSLNPSGEANLHNRRVKTALRLDYKVRSVLPGAEIDPAGSATDSTGIGHTVHPPTDGRMLEVVAVSTVVLQSNPRQIRRARSPTIDGRHLRRHQTQLRRRVFGAGVQRRGDQSVAAHSKQK